MNAAQSKQLALAIGRNIPIFGWVQRGLEAAGVRFSRPGMQIFGTRFLIGLQQRRSRPLTPLMLQAILLGGSKSRHALYRAVQRNRLLLPPSMR